MGLISLNEKELVSCCGSNRFAEMVAASSPFPNINEALRIAKDVWLNSVDVNGWLQAFAAHPQIGDTQFKAKTSTSAEWSKGEQSTAIATASGSSMQELHHWNAMYKEKFGFIFIICASGRSTPEILAELKKRYSNRPIVELEVAAMEQMKITELRLAKLFKTRESDVSLTGDQMQSVYRIADDRMGIIGSHLTASSPSVRTRPPITTHILDVVRGGPASGIEVILERWNGLEPRPTFNRPDSTTWVYLGSATTDRDGRSGQLIPTVDHVSAGLYRIRFNTGKYFPDGFFPYASIIFEIKRTQTAEHFHVPLILSPFSFSTYRGS